MYCVYSGKELDNSLFGKKGEHIIPRSLGRSNAFCIPVSISKNRLANQKIDNPMEKLVLSQIQRDIFGWEGASKKPFKGVDVVVNDDTKAKFHLNERKVYLGDNSSGKPLEEYEKGCLLCSQEKFNSEAISPIKAMFSAKCAMGTMYYLYGNEGIKHIDFGGLRDGAFNGIFKNVFFLPMFNTNKIRIHHDGNEKPVAYMHDLFSVILSTMFVEKIACSSVYIWYCKDNAIDCVTVIGNYIAGGCRFSADVNALNNCKNSRSVILHKSLLNNIECVICRSIDKVSIAAIEFCIT